MAFSEPTGDSPVTRGAPSAAPSNGAGVTEAFDTGADYRRWLLESMDQGFCVIEMIFGDDGVAVDYRFLETNAAFERQTGLSHVLGQRMRELVPLHEQHWFDLYGNVARTGQPLRSENLAAALDRWFSLYAFRVGGAGSNRVAVMFSDITARKRAEERTAFFAALSRRLEKATSELELINAATEAVGIQLNADRCYFIECREAENLVAVSPNWIGDRSRSVEGRYSLKDFGGVEWWRQYSLGNFAIDDVRTHPATAKRLAAFEAVGVRAYAVQPFRHEGEWSVVLGVTKATPRKWRNHEIALMDEVVARVWPLVERARIDQALRENQAALRVTAERFRLLSENVAVQVWTATPDGQLDYVNQECLDYLGPADVREITGDGWTRFIHPDDLPNVIQVWRKSLASGQRYDVEFRLRGKTGEYRWFLTRAEAMRENDGRIARWFGTNTDIDELRTARVAAERANRAKDEFLAVLSHELRTPLTPVLMMATSLSEDERLPPETREQLRMMERNIGLEARLIDDLLDLTKISHGKLQLRTQPSDAHALIELAAEIVLQEAGAKGIAIEKRFAAQRSGLEVDPARFQQVIWNLLRNAVKFTPPGGKISVCTSEQAEPAGETWLRIDVADTGIGINPEDLDQIFRPFDQGRLGGNHRYGGVGLGLTIARAVVAMHGGRISAHSAGTDRGATFVLEFPGATQPPHSLPGPTPPSRTAGPARKGVSLRVLLVEDHEATLQALLHLLKRDGHRVSAATTIAQALELAAAASHDVVISDLGLPDGSGLELMVRLREGFGLKGIALSGYGMTEDIARSHSAGFSTHLVKPVSSSELRRVLSSLHE